MTSGPGSVTASNGMFHVTDAQGKSQTVDLGTLMLLLNIDRTKNLDQQIAIQLDEIQKRNDTLRQLTELMAQCRKLKAEGQDDGAPSGAAHRGSGSGKVTINGTANYLQGSGGWAEKFGISWTDAYGDRPSDKDKAAQWDACWDANINAIKGKIDALNNDSQLDNIKLQNLLEKRGNAFEMASKVMDTNNQSIQSVIRNL